MFDNIVAPVVDACVRQARAVLVIALIVTVACGYYAATHFALNSDINALLPGNVPWRQNELAFEKSFKQFGVIDVLVSAPTPELAAAATRDLAEGLSAKPDMFPSVANLAGSDYIQRVSLMLQPLDGVKKTAEGLVQGGPLIHDFTSDPSIRGLIAGLEDTLIGVNSGRLKLDDLARPFAAISATLDDVLKGQPASFSWRALAEGKSLSINERRGILEVRPKLDFHDLQPGEAATKAIRDLAAPLESRYRAQVRLTGPVPMDDEQFGSIKENALRNGVVTLAIVGLILWLALRSGRLILALVVNLIVGLAVTAAAGLALVGSFNLISIYFAVLFVGIGVDFAIQFSVRYRDERHRVGDLPTAIRGAGRYVATPLALASLATACGFFSFLPTDYKGVSELGLVAGVGMLIAFVSSVTVLPALIELGNPKGEAEGLGYTWLAPLDRFLERRRIPVIVGTLLIVACASPLLMRLKFDFNPIDLQDPKGEATATYLELSRDPESAANAVQILAPNIDAAKAIAARMAKLPEVAATMTVASFIPDDQDQKIPILKAASAQLADDFHPKDMSPAPTDAENVEALNEGAQRLHEGADGAKGPGAEASLHLADQLQALAKQNENARKSAAEAFLWPLGQGLKGLERGLNAEPASLESLPTALRDDWVADGMARVSVTPKGSLEDMPAMRRFANSVLAIAPTATEGPIAIFQAGDTILKAFVEAGIWALLSIAVLLWIVLRRIGDVLLTLIPLALAALVTMEIMSAIGMAFNFANIIALPLLLGVGVAFKIYYIMAWRQGVTHLLQTSLTRAVAFSAMTTATAFGSLWFSSHPGTSSMGKLLALSLCCTLAAAVLFQPVLMGKPRTPAPAPPA